MSPWQQLLILGHQQWGQLPQRLGRPHLAMLAEENHPEVWSARKHPVMPKYWSTAACELTSIGVANPTSSRKDRQKHRVMVSHLILRFFSTGNVTLKAAFLTCFWQRFGFQLSFGWNEEFRPEMAKRVLGIKWHCIFSAQHVRFVVRGSHAET